MGFGGIAELGFSGGCGVEFGWFGFSGGLLWFCVFVFLGLGFCEFGLQAFVGGFGV